ncbi:MAG TPA: phosphomannomutase/phosphoglucomutase [Propionibacteriaceae bacterium]|nr:phosphomannomutase/phosphoglucomutase [Propionibacteriaceae bacterium]
MLTTSIFKANDIRGIVGGPEAEWDVAGATALGRAYVDVAGLAGETFVMSRDMRTSGPELSQAFARGATQGGASVVDVGLASTDELWFASGHLGLPGVQFTASHNPARYNGAKFCKVGAKPVTSDFLDELRTRAMAYDAEGLPGPVAEPGTVTTQDILGEYGSYLRSLVDLDGIRHLKVVVDAGNGMAGHTVPSVLGPLNVDVVGLYLDLDGSFPNHQPNPLEPQNLVDAQNAVVEHHADLALVFDGDADRCFVIDERGHVVSPSTITALIAAAELAREPGATIVVNTITSRSVAEVVAEKGGTLVTSKVGHTYVKALMAEHGAIFGGEHSAHYYFRDFWGADTGMLAGLHVLGLLGHAEVPLSILARSYQRYVASGEINSRVDDQQATMEKVAAAYEGRGEISWEDGLVVRGDRWWVSLRSSNTEPLLRLNVEAPDEATMVAWRDETLRLVRGEEKA